MANKSRTILRLMLLVVPSLLVVTAIYSFNFGVKKGFESRQAMIPPQMQPIPICNTYASDNQPIGVSDVVVIGEKVPTSAELVKASATIADQQQQILNLRRMMTYNNRAVASSRQTEHLAIVALGQCAAESRQRSVVK